MSSLLSKYLAFDEADGPSYLFRSYKYKLYLTFTENNVIIDYRATDGHHYTQLYFSRKGSPVLPLVTKINDLYINNDHLAFSFNDEPLSDHFTIEEFISKLEIYETFS